MSPQPPEKVNVLNILLWLGLILLFGAFALNALFTGEIGGALGLGALTLLFLGLMVVDLRKGVRPPTRYERFRAWMIVRPMLVGAVGLVVLSGVVGDPLNWQREQNAEIEPPLLIFFTLWMVALSFTFWRAPRRRESDERYKRRVGYRE